jgi:CII-binding regulator of phage lambda lysogenization HflD
MNTKRIVAALFILLVTIGLYLYAGLSSKQSFTKSVAVGCTDAGALRTLLNDKNSTKAWPGEKINDSTYRFEQLQYSIGNAFINTLTLHFTTGETGELIIEKTTPDSSQFTIQLNTLLPINPIARIKKYLELRETTKKIGLLLQILKENFKGEEIVYGINIQLNRVTDSVMISTRKLMDHYPAVQEIYQMIEDILSYIKTNGGEESNAPMLNVFKEGANQYLVMVAVPTKTPVKGNETYLQKHMLPNGYILVSDITGGNYTIQQSEKAMYQYVMDHQKSSPAIPFQMLITDRRTEADTTKWKTRLYYPVMY